MEIHGLKPGQKYHYQVRMDGAIVSDGHAFMTFPRMHRPSDFTVAFGEVLLTPLNSNASLPPSKAGNLLRSSNWVTISMWINRKNHLSSATVTTGDRVPAPYRSLVSNVNVASIWDDHDFGDDDCWYGGDPNQPPFKREVWKVFRENWNNHAYGLGQENPGCYHDFYIGDVHFILLDGRYYRTDPTNASGRSMLGQTQLDWLLKTLEHSRGTFKILASPVPFAKGVKPGSRDPWDGYPEERSRIFSISEITISRECCSWPPIAIVLICGKLKLRRLSALRVHVLSIDQYSCSPRDEGEPFWLQCQTLLWSAGV